MPTDPIEYDDPATTDPDATQDDQNVDAGQSTAESSEGETESDDTTFDLKYVKRLRGESANHRTRAKAAEDQVENLQNALFQARVSALGIVADPTDVPFDAEILDDPDALKAKAMELVKAKPHLRARKVTGNIDQGVKGGENAKPDDLGALIRAAL